MEVEVRFEGEDGDWAEKVDWEADGQTLKLESGACISQVYTSAVD